MTVIISVLAWHTTVHLLFAPGVEWPALVLPLVIELAVLGRGLYTREPAEVVLAAVAVPCLLVSTLAVVEGMNSVGGIYWGELFSVVAGGLLTSLVVMDIIIRLVVKRRASE